MLPQPPHVNNFSGNADGTVDIQAGANQYFRLTTDGTCPDIDWKTRVGNPRPRRAAISCATAMTRDFIVPDPSGHRALQHHHHRAADQGAISRRAGREIGSSPRRAPMTFERLRLMAIAIPPSARTAPDDGDRGPAVILERGRQAHGDDRHDHRGISRLGRADRANHRIVEHEGEHRGGKREIEQARPIARAPLDLRRAGDQQARAQRSSPHPRPSTRQASPATASAASPGAPDRRWRAMRRAFRTE